MPSHDAPVITIGRRSDNVRQVECWFSHLTAWSALFVFVGFSDDRRLVVLMLVFFIFFVLVIIVVGIAGRHRVAHYGD